VAACVYNVMDKATESMVENADVVDGARAIGFTLGIPTRSQVGFVEDILCDRAFLDDRANNALEIATLEDIGQIGVMTPHLMANVAAAAAMARSAGVEPDRIREAIRNFRLDAHRIELVAKADGVRWIDDSKATNPHAANASLASFDRVVWIVGGLLKGVDISSLVERHKASLAAAIVIGEDRTAVLEALADKAPGVPVEEIASGAGSDVMQAAVKAAGRYAAKGDVVLLAPAAASMDQFKDYADRGNSFAVAVRSLIGGDRG
jgi:UDP-N-acetylmuramoylalanine--D-glutamate ligase